LGVSIEEQFSAVQRVPLLIQCPAVVHWVSAEPLIGPIDLTFPVQVPNPISLPDDQAPAIAELSWIVVGGESGTDYRYCEIQWIRDLVEQCKTSGTYCYVKQDCGKKSGLQGRIPDDLWAMKELPT
jgi:protein gp37